MIDEHRVLILAEEIYDIYYHEHVLSPANGDRGRF